MVDAVANVLLESLRDLVVEEVKFLSGVSNEVKKVEADLRTIHGLLMEADSNRDRTPSPTLKNCIDELKELAFKAENVLETYAVEVESKKEGKSLKKKLQRFMGILCECYSVHQVGDEIDDIRSRLADLTGSLSSISGGGGEAASYQEQRRLLRIRYAHEVDQHFVGMEKDIRSLVLMVNDTKSRSVVSICGMGGLGKTTLARKIYNHPDVKGSFDGRAWVCVTQQFQAETVLREIFQQIDGERKLEAINMGLPELVVELHNALVKRKCVIVIDDIWETNHWDILKPAFPKNCKVVLTTRNQNVASQECQLHKLDFLSEDEGWELLGKIALPINHDATQVLENISKSFEDIGRQMVKKCGRLPLAISVIGGILCQKQMILAEWEKVSSNMDSYLRHGGEGIGNDTRVKLVLDLSFDVLPYYLKPCFLYLSCFPEDEQIKTERLYLLWLAEGLISWEEKGDNETLRDVAERYLTELASRCMVQLQKANLSTPDNKFVSCRLHDLMRDLCSSKAAEENFIKRVDISKHKQDIPSAIGASIHRLAINLDVSDVESTLRKICVEGLKDLRSFLVLCKRNYEMTTIDFKNVVNFENSKHLRILSLDNAKFEDGNLLITIGKLIYLKYLSLNGCNVKELYVCHLPYLQTLDLRVENTIKLPNIISRMKRLRHLFLPENIEVIGGDKLKLDGLNELETLERINSKNACIEDIVNLMNLRRLVAKFENDMDSLSKIVDHMSSNGCQLRETYLTVESCDLRNVVKKMLMSRSLVHLWIKKCEIGCMFPFYEQGMCHNLGSLGIINCEIEGDVVEVLGKCPMLQYLWFQGGLGEVEKNSEMRFGPNSFPELKKLFLTVVSNLRKWEVEKGAMIKLRYLEIDGCRDLEKLPDGLRFISSVERVHCFGMSEEFKGRMRRGENGEGGGQDYANFSHIPFLTVN